MTREEYTKLLVKHDGVTRCLMTLGLINGDGKSANGWYPWRNAIRNWRSCFKNTGGSLMECPECKATGDRGPGTGKTGGNRRGTARRAPTGRERDDRQGEERSAE